MITGYLYTLVLSLQVRAWTASIKGAWSGSIILGKLLNNYYEIAIILFYFEDCPPTILSTAAPPTCLP